MQTRHLQQDVEWPFSWHLVQTRSSEEMAWSFPARCISDESCTIQVQLLMVRSHSYHTG
jgi:hypothetical protein